MRPVESEPGQHMATDSTGTLQSRLARGLKPGLKKSPTQKARN